MKQNLIKTADLIGKAMHPEHLQTVHTFTQRGDIVNHLMVRHSISQLFFSPPNASNGGHIDGFESSPVKDRL